MSAITDATALESFCRLAVKRGLLPGVLHSQRVADFVVVLSAAALALDAGREYSEAEVNALLKAWLAGTGAMLATDHVELRRWLVDCRLVARDGFGRRYVRLPAPEAFAAAVAGLSGIDLAAAARDARAGETAARAERKARWTAASSERREAR